MQIGKVSETVLKRSVLKHITYKSRNLVQGPAAGESFCRLAAGGKKHLITAAVSVKGNAELTGKRAFYRLANVMAAAGGRLSGMLITLYLPSDGGEDVLKAFMDDLAQMSAAYQVDILGGHTEVLEALSEAILSLTGTGFADEKTNVRSGNLKPGFDLVMTKWAGQSGAAQLVRSEERSGLRLRFADDFLDRASNGVQAMSSIEDAEFAIAQGTDALCSVGAKGVFGALWEMGEASGTGVRVDLKKIPIRQETIEICEYFDRNPYLIASDGVLLAGTSDGARLVEGFKDRGIPAAVIGTVTDGRDRVIINGEETRFLVPPAPSYGSENV